MTNKHDGLTTIEQIARDMSYKLTFDDRKYVKSGKNTFDAVGRLIRNEYGLWVDHPLTETWRMNPDTRVVKNGVDYSEDHPDQVSNAIRLRLIEILKEEDGE